MKVLFITREGYRLPGARVRCYNFAREIRKYNVQAEVLSFSDTLGAKDGEDESGMGLGDRIGFNCRAFKRLALDKKAIFFLQRFNYHSFAPYLAHLLNRNKIVLDLDDWEIRENPRYYLGFWPSSKAHYLTRNIAKRSILCIAASRFLEHFLSEFNKKTYYIPSGVDTELFTPPINDPDEDKIIFSWTGTLHKKEYIENIKFALDCFIILRKKYSHIYLDIIGDGIYRPDLLFLLNRLSDAHVHYRGWFTPESMPDYLKSITIGILPVASDTRFNRAKSPTKLFEYMAVAKPTISSTVGEAAYIIRDGENGFLAKTKEEFIDKMDILVRDITLRKQMGINARKTIEENYSLNILGKRLYAILSQINA